MGKKFHNTRYCLAQFSFSFLNMTYRYILYFHIFQALEIKLYNYLDFRMKSHTLVIGINYLNILVPLYISRT
jgi:hypothetical protein